MLMFVDVCAWNRGQSQYGKLRKLKNKCCNTENLKKCPTNGFMISLS